MSGQNKEVPAYWVAKSLAEDYEGDAIDVREVISGCFFLTWTGAAATDAVVKAQESGTKAVNDWHDISSASVTIAAASGKAIIKLTADVLQCPFVRLVIVDNTESAGTVTAGYFFKGNR